MQLVHLHNFSYVNLHWPALAVTNEWRRCIVRTSTQKKETQNEPCPRGNYIDMPSEADNIMVTSPDINQEKIINNECGPRKAVARKTQA